MDNKVVAIKSNKALEELLEDKQKSIAESLPKHLAKDPRYVRRMIKAILVAVTRQPKLLQCSKLSMMQSVMIAAELGLDPSGTLGSGYLIPYGNQVVFMAGYRGLIELALRSQEILDIDAQVVYEKDEYRVVKGLTPELIHIPHEGADRGKIRAAYMVTILKNGIRKFENMWADEIQKVRDCSKAPNSPAWTEFPGQMARKSVIRRGMKYLPLCTESERALALVTSEEDKFLGLPDIEEATIPQEGRTSFGKAKKEIPVTVDVPQDAKETPQSQETSITGDEEKPLEKSTDEEKLNIETEPDDPKYKEFTGQENQEEEVNFNKELDF